MKMWSVNTWCVIENCVKQLEMFRIRIWPQLVKVHGVLKQL